MYYQNQRDLQQQRDQLRDYQRLQDQIRFQEIQRQNLKKELKKGLSEDKKKGKKYKGFFSSATSFFDMAMAPMTMGSYGRRRRKRDINTIFPEFQAPVTFGHHFIAQNAFSSSYEVTEPPNMNFRVELNEIIREYPNSLQKVVLKVKDKPLFKSSYEVLEDNTIRKVVE